MWVWLGVGVAAYAAFLCVVVVVLRAAKARNAAERAADAAGRSPDAHSCDGFEDADGSPSPVDTAGSDCSDIPGGHCDHSGDTVSGKALTPESEGSAAPSTATPEPLSDAPPPPDVSGTAGAPSAASTRPRPEDHRAH
ncbi:MAG TPA: hypothetical protein VLH10_24725 [Yinghuangia sp.]|uniref:hypothetical protein n=1 Tax=Yinghuangia sp. YIM S10712 TaxID=3436930 RepID=UPI002BC8FE60|nr:hypothetical protein [Yinghuangia sp.]